MTADTYEIYAVCYAHHHRLARESFLDGDPHDESPMPARVTKLLDNRIVMEAAYAETPASGASYINRT
jgi:hypothetical protein